MLVQYWALLFNTLQLPLFKCRCMDKIIIKKYYFTPPLPPPSHFGSAVSSGNFRASLHKHAGKDSEERETLTCFISTVKGFSETLHPARGRIFREGGTWYNNTL